MTVLALTYFLMNCFVMFFLVFSRNGNVLPESSAQNEWHLFVLCRGNKKLNVGSFNYSSQSCSSFNALFFDISLKGGVLKNMTVRLENRGK